MAGISQYFYICFSITFLVGAIALMIILMVVLRLCCKSRAKNIDAEIKRNRSANVLTNVSNSLSIQRPSYRNANMEYFPSAPPALLKNANKVAVSIWFVSRNSSTGIITSSRSNQNCPQRANGSDNIGFLLSAPPEFTIVCKNTDEEPPPPYNEVSSSMHS